MTEPMFAGQILDATHRAQLERHGDYSSAQTRTIVASTLRTLASQMEAHGRELPNLWMSQQQGRQDGLYEACEWAEEVAAAIERLGEANHLQ